MGVVFCDCFKKAKQNHQEPSLSQETNNNSKDVSEENTAPLLPKAKSNEQSDFPISNINSNLPLKRFESKNSKMSIGDDFFFGIDKAVIIGKGTGNPKEIYQFGNQLGKGSYGSVFVAKHKQTGALRAVKIIKKSQGSNKSSWITNDILREIELLKSLDHQNIIKIFEFYEGMKMFYIVTEFCKGGELFTKLKQEGGQDEITSGIIMFQLFSAINYCHSRKVMHRDLKPENIMLEDATKNGMIHVKIIDFGTAKIYEKEFEKQVIGTPYYIAPEVIDKKYNEKCDLWSLGVIMYVLLKGKFPFGGSDTERIFANIKKGIFDITSPPFDHISKEAIDLIKKLLVINPNKRISAEEALNHKWFTNMKIKEKLSELPVNVMKDLLHNVYNYHPDKILQQAALAYLVHNNPQMKEVHNACSLYVKIDKNNDGLIKRDEFYDGLHFLFKEQGQDVDEEMLEDFFRIIDADGSGDIEYEEFVRAAVDKKKFLDETILKFAFDFFDKDKSGKITLEEVKEIFQQNKEFPEQDFQMIIDQVDNNSDGMIDFNEFKEMMTNILN